MDGNRSVSLKHKAATILQLFPSLNYILQKIMYEINYDDQSCEKSPLDFPFETMDVPEDALFMSQMVLGTSSVPGQSLLVNNWSGYIMDNTGETYSTYAQRLQRFNLQKQMKKVGCVQEIMYS